ncbi:beta-mannosidase [Pontimicrobium aquaticum]|uniref:beta-mannosidase n=1 Tax=Pontimicrobium aquaticum TaxID=2565367 RepID=UPI001EF11ABC|nr:glycoside hydrolase family 2 protein [Pontimicrobium aquaticum]
MPQTIELHRNWEFKKVNDSNWNPATVPGNVHSDLLENNLIENPFIGNNEHNLQWISESDWEYKTTFSIDKKTLKKQNISLFFEGLDTYASVYLNDSLILKSNNAFRKFHVDVKPLLKPENTLRILFENTTKFEEQEKTKLGYSLPEGNRIFTRKAQFQYGWDWGPKLNTSGIWRPVKLVTWNDYKIEDIYIKQVTLNDSIASLKLDITDSNLDGLTYQILVNDTLIPFEKSDLTFQIKDPKRWWPHNLGEPYLYDIKVVVKKGNAILDSISTKIGLRTIELVTEKDSIGESFYFRVNDVPVYAKGANYIPQNSMQNKVTDAHYETLLDDVVDANMNMLRVWGGGIYENDIFYDFCDEKGILVWQDFMFACAMYPGDKNYLQNVQQEAIDNVKRLRNHASIVLWCGNNENSEGWHRWGWQDGRSEIEKEEIWNNYLKVFDSILPNTVADLTNTDYWESSPKYGRGNPNYEFEGDAHDWWIWHDAYPFEHLEEKVPRFMSEFGMQSFPSYEVINYINQSDPLEFNSEGFKNHQKHIRGFELIYEYMKRDFPVPTKAEDYVYMSQVVQAYGITKGIEAQRRAKPYNMGTLYWQLNDCWPSISWSSIDFFGNWKALHYKAKKSFENILVSSKAEDNVLKTFIINDNLEEVTDTLYLKLIDFSGKKLWSYSKEITASKNSSELVHELNLKGFDRRNTVLVSSFKNSTSTYYLAKPKKLKFQQAEITKKITKTKTGFNIKLLSSSLQKDVFLYSKEKGHFSDNYFDLLPNETVEIEFETKSSTLEDLKIKTMNEFVN